MAVDTYAKLQSECMDSLNRTDIAADVTDFSPGTVEGAVKRAIAKGELRVIRRLKVKEFETSTAFSTVGGVETIAIPSDHAATKAIVLTSSPQVTLASKDLTTLINDNPSTAQGVPSAYTLFGTTARLRPIPDSARALTWFYYSKPTALSDTNTSNAILANFPDLLHYAAMVELSLHLEDDARLQYWKGMFDEAVKDITNDNTANRYSGAPIRSSVDIRTII